MPGLKLRNGAMYTILVTRRIPYSNDVNLTVIVDLPEPMLTKAGIGRDKLERIIPTHDRLISVGIQDKGGSLVLSRVLCDENGETTDHLKAVRQMITVYHNSLDKASKWLHEHDPIITRL